MSITLHLDLPDALAREASAGGLLEPRLIGDLIAAELRRRRASVDLQQVLVAVRSQPGEAVPMEEIVATVRAVRRGRRSREAGH